MYSQYHIKLQRILTQYLEMLLQRQHQAAPAAESCNLPPNTTKMINNYNAIILTKQQQINT